MSKTEFTLILDEVLNDFDCKLEGLRYTDDNIAIIDYSPNSVNVYRTFFPYRFANRAKIRVEIMYELDLLVPVDPELDLGF